MGRRFHLLLDIRSMHADGCCIKVSVILNQVSIAKD